MHDVDRSLLAEIEELLPERIFDVHVHVWQRAHLGAGVAGFGHWLTRDQYLSEDLTAEFALLFPGRTCSALLFPLPVADGDVAAMNRYLANLVGGTATPGAVTRGAEAPGVELPDTKMPGAATPGGARPDVQMPDAATPGADTSSADTRGAARPDAEPPGTVARNPEPRAAARRYALMIPPLDASAEELSRLVTGGGFLGFKPYWTFAGTDLRSVAVSDFVTPAQLEAAHELRLIIMLHPPGNLVPHQGAIRAAALRYPAATIILPHCATCYHYAPLAASIDSVRDLPNVHFDLSTVTAGDVVSLLLREVGPERVMFGTDFPFASERMTLAYLESGLVPVREATAPPPPAGRRYAFTYLIYEQLRALRAARDLQRLTAADLDAIMYGNAERLVQRTAAALG